MANSLMGSRFVQQFVVLYRKNRERQFPSAVVLVWPEFVVLLVQP